MVNHSAAPEPVATTISGLSHDGRGISHIQGKTTFIENALPGEQVLFTYTHKHNKYDEGKTQQILIASPYRVSPRCIHYGVCGGCSLQHMDQITQLQLKQKQLLDHLKHFGRVVPERVLPSLTSSAWGYRRRARLSVKYVAKKQAVLVGFHEKNGRYVANLQRCEILHPTVGNAIAELQDLISRLTVYQQIPQIEIAVADKVTALVLRNLAPLTENDLKQLKNFAQQHIFSIYLQPQGPESIKLVWPEENAQTTLTFTLPGYGLTFEFQPTDFIQINASLNEALITHTLQLLDPQANECILDLFCGLGNFTLPLAKYCRQVVGVEGEVKLIQRARSNATHNHINNVNFYTTDLAKDFMSSLWTKQTFDKILLDPPRTGALVAIQQLRYFKARRIVYVSCNPATLARDAGELINQGYRLLAAGIIDMFPHTQHVESVAMFDR